MLPACSRERWQVTRVGAGDGVIHVLLNHGLAEHGMDEGAVTLEAVVCRKDGYDPV
jgi:hypothetical protein